jgi:hypothetical protein
MSKEQVDACYKVDERAIRGFFEDHRWLSNYHICNVMFEGDIYPSSENAFQAAKAMWCERNKFFTCTPSESKKLGSKITMSARDVELWDQRKKRVMRVVLFDKFTRNPELKDQLLATGNKYLEEANWWGDIFWGVCDGVGENNLGKLLMEVRAALRGVG